jgi:hypothetical protein
MLKRRKKRRKFMSRMKTIKKQMRMQKIRTRLKRTRLLPENKAAAPVKVKEIQVRATNRHRAALPPRQM